MEPLGHGRVLGRFRLQEKLALGGMAEIWSAEDTEGAADAPPIALKLLLPQFVKDPHFRAMFFDEVRIATLLNHPNIVAVHGAHDVDGFLFQSMEWIDGRDLRRILSQLIRGQRRFPISIALLVAHKVARALSYAHERKGPDGQPLDIVHRDVSPHNVMISRSGEVKLLDFGIARAAERMARTKTDVVNGKLSYMAPEQALAVGVTPQTDVFALGVVLWELLAMRRLFVAKDDASLVDCVVRAEVPPIRSFNSEVSEEVEVLLGQMLAQRAPNRPASMRTVEQSLARAVAKLDDSVGLSSSGTSVGQSPSGNSVGQSPSGTSVSDWMAEILRPPAIEPAEADRTEPTAVVEDPKASADVTSPQSVLPEVGADPTVDNPGEKTPKTPSTTSDSSTDPVRLPTHSEIVRAVEKQATLPVLPASQAASNPGRASDSVPTEPERRAPWLAELVQSGAATRSPSNGRAPVRAVGAQQPKMAGPVLPDRSPSVSPAAPAGDKGNRADSEVGSASGRGRFLPVVTLMLAVLVVVLAILLVVRR